MGKDHFNLDFLDNLFPNLAFSKSYFHIVPNVVSNLLYIVSIVVPYFLHRFKFTLHRFKFISHRSKFISHRSKFISHRFKFISHRFKFISHRSNLKLI